MNSIRGRFGLKMGLTYLPTRKSSRLYYQLLYEFRALIRVDII